MASGKITINLDTSEFDAALKSLIEHAEREAGFMGWLMDRADTDFTREQCFGLMNDLHRGKLIILRTGAEGGVEVR